MVQNLIDRLQTPVLVLRDSEQLIIADINLSAAQLIFPGIVDKTFLLNQSVLGTQTIWDKDTHPLLNAFSAILQASERSLEQNVFEEDTRGLSTKIVFSFQNPSGEGGIYQLKISPFVIEETPPIAALLIEAADIRHEVEAMGMALKSDGYGFIYSRPIGPGIFGTSEITDNLLELLGVSREEYFNGRDIGTFVHPDDLEMFEDRNRRQATGELVEPMQIRLIPKSGEIKTFKFTCTSSLLDGKPIQITTIAHDISESVRLEQSLRESRDGMEMAFMNNPIGQIIIGKDGKIILVNPTAQKEMAELIRIMPEKGLDFYDFIFSDEDKLVYAEIINKVFETGEMEILESQFNPTPDNPDSNHWFHNVFIRVKDGIDGVMMMTQDVTVLKKIITLMEGRTEELMRAMASAVELREAKEGGTFEHIKRLSQMIEEIGTILGFPPEVLKTFRSVGWGHDIGKISLSDEILFGGKLLTGNERGILVNHILTFIKIKSFLKSNDPFIEAISYGIIHHHQDWNGKGYPFVKRLKDGVMIDVPLEGLEIPFEARLLRILDSADAMQSLDRKYKDKALGPYTTMVELTKGAGKQYDPHLTVIVVEYFLENHQNYFYGIRGDAGIVPLPVVETNNREDVLDALEELKQRIKEELANGTLQPSDLSEQLANGLFRDPELIKPENILSYNLIKNS